MQNVKPRLWQWRALGEQGHLYEGYVLAHTHSEALASLLARNIIPLTLRPRVCLTGHDWRLRYKIDFLRQLAALVKAGIALDTGCRMLAEQHPSLAWRTLLEQAAENIAHGEPLSAVLGRWPAIFPPLFTALVHTGEITGRLDICCQRLAQQQEQQYQLHKKILKAVRYPAFTLLIAVLVSGAMLGFVLPEFAAIYKSFNAPLPALTRATILLSEGLVHHAALCLIALILPTLVWSSLRKKPYWQSLEQKIILTLPILKKLVRGQRLSQIHTTLALTQQAGIPLLQGLDVVELALANPWWQAKLRGIYNSVSAGNPFSQALMKADIFTPLCLQLVRTGEESGSLDSMLDTLAEWHAEHTEELADSLTAALEPLMMVITGTLIGTLVTAMYLPIFQLGEAMGMG